MPVSRSSDRDSGADESTRPRGWVLFYFNTERPLIADHPHVIVPNEQDYMGLWRAVVGAKLGVVGVPVPYGRDGVETMRDPCVDLPFSEWSSEPNQARIHEFSRNNEFSTLYVDCAADLSFVSEDLGSWVLQRSADRSLGIVRLAARLGWAGGIIGEDKDKVAFVVSESHREWVERMETRCLSSGRPFSRIAGSPGDGGIWWTDIAPREASLGLGSR